MMILLAEFSTPPRNVAVTPGTNAIQKDFRPILQNIKTIPEHLIEETRYQTLLVKRLSGVPEPANGAMATLSQMGEARTTYLRQLDISIVEVPSSWDADWLLEIIHEDPSVNYAGMDYSGNRVPNSLPYGTRPNDPSFGDQTNLHDPINDVDVDAPEAWAYTTGSDSVVVVVADGDFDINNPELRPNLWVNEAELRGIPGRDDDANGCIDDIHGCNIFGGVNPIFGNGNFGDDAGHGTEVASVLGARGNNNNEITGVAWNIKLMFLDDTLSMHGHEYILTMRRRGVNIRVINFSIGSLDNCDSTNLSPRSSTSTLSGSQKVEHMAFEELMAEGILVVQAMGNFGINYNSQRTQLHTPACYNLDNIIAAAGQSKAARERWSGSNYGDIIADLYAPAERIPTSPRLFVQNLPGLPDFQIDPDGTSLAAPHVAGAAALLWSFRPDLTITEVRSALLDTVDRFDSFKLRDENGVPTTDTVASGGALNIANALYSVATPGIRIHSSQTTIAEGTS
ncbi:MAG: S8 family serine peptidase, partial [Gammaproteobacteria bacterium]|nr:S8 family serine peptidase [Gammaproteobacteria bacterium]